MSGNITSCHMSGFCFSTPIWRGEPINAPNPSGCALNWLSGSRSGAPTIATRAGGPAAVRKGRNRGLMQGLAIPAPAAPTPSRSNLSSSYAARCRCCRITQLDQACDPISIQMQTGPSGWPWSFVRRYATSPGRSRRSRSTRNLANASSVALLAWCSSPSASASAVARSRPIATRNCATSS